MREPEFQAFETVGREERKAWVQNQYNSGKVSKEQLRAAVESVERLKIRSLTEAEYEEITGEVWKPTGR